jgi:hypothetical protein
VTRKSELGHVHLVDARGKYRTIVEAADVGDPRGHLADTSVPG